MAIELEGIRRRLHEVPLPPGNYRALSTNGQRLFLLDRETGLEPETRLLALGIGERDAGPDTLVEDVEGYELSRNGKKLLVTKEDDHHVIPASAGADADLSDAKLDLSGWRFTVDPKEEWRGLFVDSWRLERDYFYDPGMHGVDWEAMLEKYLPLVDRVTTREELAALQGEMGGQLAALHTYVGPGDVREGDVITHVDGVELLGVADPGVHLRAMGRRNIAEWHRHFYPAYDRKGLVIDVRHNRGGNIDSWILERLLRKAWFYWQPRVGDPYWNMQYAFRGHAVMLVDERTASDGEAVAEGFRRLGLGELIGIRTWGGEIWLTASNDLADEGILTASEFGVYGLEGEEWLIEGHGVEPDIVVDNLPRATFGGEDAQLRAAVEHLEALIREDPRTVPDHPPYPDKSVPWNSRSGEEAEAGGG